MVIDFQQIVPLFHTLSVTKLSRESTKVAVSDWNRFKKMGSVERCRWEWLKLRPSSDPEVVEIYMLLEQNRC